MLVVVRSLLLFNFYVFVFLVFCLCVCVCEFVLVLDLSIRPLCFECDISRYCEEDAIKRN